MTPFKPVFGVDIATFSKLYEEVARIRREHNGKESMERAYAEAFYGRPACEVFVAGVIVGLEIAEACSQRSFVVLVGEDDKRSDANGEKASQDTPATDSEHVSRDTNETSASSDKSADLKNPEDHRLSRIITAS